MERFFVILARINSVLLLLLLLGGGAMVAWLSLSETRRPPAGAIEVAGGTATSGAPVLLSLERVESIAGTDTQMMRLATEQKSGKYDMSSGGRGSDTRNVLFLSGTDKTPRWLFPTQGNVVLVVEQLRGERARCESDRSTLALYFEVVTADSNGDGVLTPQDRLTIALSRPDGQGLVEVLQGVGQVLSRDVLEDGRLSIVYQTGKSVRHAMFTLSTLKKDVDREIVNLPERL